MTFTDDLHATVAALTQLAVRGSDHLTPRELDIALIGRAAVLDLLTDLHRDLTGIRPRRTHVTAAEIQAHPVAALAAALRQHPRPRTGRAPSDVLAEPATSVAGQAWRDVARHAILAAHAWSTERHAPAEEGGQAWGGIADVAAIAGVLADLDADLAAAATHMTGRTAAADALLQGGDRRAGLGGTGDRGPGRRRAPARPRPWSRRPRRTGSSSAPSDPTGLVAAQEQLAALLRTAGHLRPERLQLITIGHLRACTALAAALETAPTNSAPGAGRGPPRGRAAAPCPAPPGGRWPPRARRQPRSEVTRCRSARPPSSTRPYTTGKG